MSGWAWMMDRLMGAGLASGALGSGSSNRAGSALALLAFEAPAPVLPVKVPALPQVKPRAPRFWQCEFCDRVSVDPETLCDPVPMS